MKWQPIGPGTWQPEREPTIDDIIREQQQDAAIASAPANVRTGADPDPDEMMSAGIVFQKCGGGRRVLKKRIGAN
jgi:hypothetical protein